MHARMLAWAAVFLLAAGLRLAMAAEGDRPKETIAKDGVPMVLVPAGAFWMGLPEGVGRSEEHTSELQSQSNLVCRLLLEKKKQSDNRPMIARPDRGRTLTR